ncbi:methionine biosynthesis protein MetW [SAR86 cluster bacterium]|nr:methionine biosynthesis protein MetW [SAR86 cluster bacterium]
MFNIIKEWIPEESHILDLGCGDGSMLADLKNELNINGLGVDIEEKNIQLSLEKGLSVIEQDIDLGLENFKNKSFDVVLMSQSFQTLKKPETALNEIIRIGNESIVSIPNFANLRCRIQLFITGKMPISSALPHDWHSTPNLHLCSLKDFEELCTNANITIAERKLIKNSGKSTILTRSFPNLFAEIAVYKIFKKS